MSTALAEIDAKGGVGDKSICAACDQDLVSWITAYQNPVLNSNAWFISLFFNVMYDDNLINISISFFKLQMTKV